MTTWNEYIQRALAEERRRQGKTNEETGFSMRVANILKAVEQIEKMEKSGYHKKIKDLKKKLDQSNTMGENNQIGEQLRTIILNIKNQWDRLSL